MITSSISQQKGDIDLVFFGTTATEMWWWPGRGRAAWDREFGSLKAANFGSQGTTSKASCGGCGTASSTAIGRSSCVLQFGPGDSSDCRPVRSRAPRRIRRGLCRRHRGDPRAPAAGKNSAPRRLSARPDESRAVAGGSGRKRRGLCPAHGRRDRLLRRYRRALFSPGRLLQLRNVGDARTGRRRHTAVPPYEVWAEELQPWLDRFVR